MFKNKILLITGGTGSFGNAVLNKFVHTDIGEIRIFSRDEKKQEDMRSQYNNSKIKYYIGDVRNLSSIKNAMHDVDFVFHAAALKQVPSCEFFPMEAVRTNVEGTDNIITAGIEEGVEKIICLSTDKAVYPINAMGISKAMMERVFVSRSRNSKTLICGTRCGNIMCSRGSVIPLFIEQIKNNEPITVTDEAMTQFMMSLDDAINLVLFAFENGRAGDIFVQKAPACTIADLVQALKELFDVDNVVKTIGIRHGEKMYESLLTEEESAKSKDMGDFYRVPADTGDLNYDKYFAEETKEKNMIGEYHSSNTRQLSVKELKEKLMSIKYVLMELNYWRNKK